MAFAKFSTGETVSSGTGITADRAGRGDPSTDLYADNLKASVDPSAGQTWDRAARPTEACRVRLEATRTDRYGVHGTPEPEIVLSFFAGQNPAPGRYSTVLLRAGHPVALATPASPDFELGTQP
jgi:hypothetical protein